jgi:FkbM family methyltransferase
MNKLKIAIVDVIGLNYDGTTLSKKGIGGSESSIISIARELVKIGFEVSIFNDCQTNETSPGTYDGVVYYPVTALGDRDYQFDIVISQRTVIPFTPIHLYDQVKQSPPRDFDPELFRQLQRPNQLKILWMQDTFIWGDHLVEPLLINNYIDEVFLLSDWHISYVANTFSHGPRRNFEVFKNRIFHTRNAINRYIDWVDVKAKDPNLFVYNASVTKGMDPLIRRIWPKIKVAQPKAKLKIIGGYYKFRDERGLSPANQQVIELQKLTEHDPSIEFTGIIPQPKIAEIMAKASAFLYPGAYPETSGISSIESINYNTPVIGTRFGAMEESSTDSASYFIDYPIEPNGLFPWIDPDQQAEDYARMVLQTINNPYLHQQKQNACNAAKDVSTWDTVALQWKQHFFRLFGLPMTDLEQAQVDWINYRVHKVFGRRYINQEEIVKRLPPPEITRLPNPQIKLAFIDIVGMSYDGSTLSKKGMGGSESAVILVSEQLAKIGFDVTVFNGCDEDGSLPGEYNGVTYKPLSAMAANTDKFDVVISSRCVTPFITKPWYNYPQTTNRKFNYRDFEYIRNNAKLKIFWMHDTFCWGDDILENLTTAGAIDEIWTLSDFHAMYVMTCSHPNFRCFEVLRRKMWVTRNGMVKYFDSVDLDAKDPNKFIFNANMSKGLDPLLNRVWPKVKARLPDARLTVIGGFYKLGSAFAHDNEKEEFDKIASASYDDPTITFTGIIPQSEVAEHCASASYFIYPAALPETYGISTLESLYGNTPLITCRFGALEETATELSYMINYSMLPNGLFPNIDAAKQADLFVDLLVSAYNNPQEHRRRMEALDELKDLVGWDVTALEWKQHIYGKLGLYLSREENQQAAYTKSKYHKIFNRRNSSSEEWLAPKQGPEKKIVVVSPFYKAEDFVARCIASVASQDYDNYEHILIDDASTDDGYAVARRMIADLPANIQNKFRVIRNAENIGAGYNYVTTIRQQDPDSIIIMLDGDDCLSNRPDIFDHYNRLHDDYDFTYGSMWSMVDDIPLIAQPYPPEVKDNKNYKNYRFNWNIPYTHLRTMKAKFLMFVPDKDLQDADGNWYKAGNDLAIFYSGILNVDPSRVLAVSDIVYNYNDASPYNDYKINREEQDRTIAAVVPNAKAPALAPQPKKARPPEKKKILIAIPTNRNIEADTFKSIYDLRVPDGYETVFQYFWGYQVEQVRNLIAHWTIRNQFDYLFAVDSDISFPPDTLERLLSHDRDIVSGVYIQRIPGKHTIEIMRKNAHGGVTHVDWADIKDQGLVSIDSCGFGCVLVKTEVFKGIEYPQFVYKSAIDHANTISEDVYFCNKARAAGFTLWCDTDVICDHTGSYTFRVDRNIVANTIDPVERRLLELYNSNNLDSRLIEYIQTVDMDPKIIYDIGANVGEWTKTAKKRWGHAEVIKFEAMDEVKVLYDRLPERYHLGVLSDLDGKTVEFYQNPEHPMGNSYYKENESFSPPGCEFDDRHRVTKSAMTLDSVVAQKNFPIADFIKIDVQGAELDILKGAQQALGNCTDLFIELQHKEYNLGAPNKDEIIAYLSSLGFELVCNIFLKDCDGDYHFRKSAPKKKNNLRSLSNQRLMPPGHQQYLQEMKDKQNITPKVIYDIGACVLHWQTIASEVWTDSEYYLFEAMEDSEVLFKERGLPYNIGLLSDQDSKDIAFYENTEHPGGNSYYRENPEINPEAAVLFSDDYKVIKKSITLDTAVKQKGFPPPDLIKMDIQGAEMDVLKGAQECLKTCKDLILELQHVPYNKGAPLVDEVVAYVESIGFRLVTPMFASAKGVDGDYHFTKK